MLRITVVAQSPEEVVLRVAGSVAGEGVELLAQEGEHRLRTAQRLVLDLSEVQFIDREGLALLRRWSKTGLELRGAALFVRMLLEKHGLA